MITENKDILEIYKGLGVSYVSKTNIILSHTKQRTIHIRTYLVFIIAVPLLIAILSYNTQDIFGFLATITSTILFLIYLKHEPKIWYRRIVFNKLLNTICYQQNFPRKNIVFQFNKVHFSTKKHCFKNSCYLYYYISLKNFKEKKHPLFAGCISASDEEKKIFLKLLKEYMTNEFFPSKLIETK